MTWCYLMTFTWHIWVCARKVGLWYPILLSKKINGFHPSNAIVLVQWMNWNIYINMCIFLIKQSLPWCYGLTSRAKWHLVCRLIKSFSNPCMYPCVTYFQHVQNRAKIIGQKGILVVRVYWHIRALAIIFFWSVLRTFK